MARVLIVDDNRDSCESVAKLLGTAGHEVACVENGREALAQLQGVRAPDVVVLDLVMPEMDGPSFLEVLRSYVRLQSLPVVVLTALSEGPLIDRARELNALAILRKGTAAPEDVLQAVNDAVRASS